MRSQEKIFIYDIGKTRVLKIRHQLNLKALASYGYDDNYEVKSELITETRNILMALYGGQTFESALTAHLFISGGKSKNLRGLPPTADAFKHLMRSLLATPTQKHAHVAVPTLPPATTFGWKMGALPDLTLSLTSRCVASKCTRTVLAPNSMCHVVLLAYTNGKVSNVSE